MYREPYDQTVTIWRVQGLSLASDGAYNKHDA